ncbi:uncharacterized protein LACBIDRAFT_329511 [Laccaria bicolor S238N-H82]|uniref:Predicted protein n=1 Tax=Laccaria bicolor (strain S238N-H82 / ATCC MYA-4686) TaxID=486041 RepID=B0DI98_LACBS|nr:uncharacterized protein LACBIDRAFT_329511 [Laccaria bicolor S238N-H82]EDR05644.1 predicted protein [Laccaria bicolor S238N-H82]|eukprot:XP_001883748.1 predicted protein [Laccaria bicolor S238N-H82]
MPNDSKRPRYTTPAVQASTTEKIIVAVKDKDLLSVLKNKDSDTAGGELAVEHKVTYGDSVEHKVEDNAPITVAENKNPVSTIEEGDQATTAEEEHAGSKGEDPPPMVEDDNPATEHADVVEHTFRQHLVKRKVMVEQETVLEENFVSGGSSRSRSTTPTSADPPTALGKSFYSSGKLFTCGRSESEPHQNCIMNRSIRLTSTATTHYHHQPPTPTSAHSNHDSNNMPMPRHQQMTWHVNGPVRICHIVQTATMHAVTTVHSSADLFAISEGHSPAFLAQITCIEDDQPISRESPTGHGQCSKELQSFFEELLARDNYEERTRMAQDRITENGTLGAKTRMDMEITVRILGYFCYSACVSSVTVFEADIMRGQLKGNTWETKLHFTSNEADKNLLSRSKAVASSERQPGCKTLYFTNDHISCYPFPKAFSADTEVGMEVVAELYEQLAKTGNRGGVPLFLRSPNGLF